MARGKTCNRKEELSLGDELIVCDKSPTFSFIFPKAMVYHDRGYCYLKRVTQ